MMLELQLEDFFNMICLGNFLMELQHSTYYIIEDKS